MTDEDRLLMVNGMWPQSIPGLGPKIMCPFTRCSDCGPAAHAAKSGTFQTFGGIPLCRSHATARWLATRTPADRAKMEEGL